MSESGVITTKSCLPFPIITTVSLLLVKLTYFGIEFQLTLKLVDEHHFRGSKMSTSTTGDGDLRKRGGGGSKESDKKQTADANKAFCAQPGNDRWPLLTTVDDYCS